MPARFYREQKQNITSRNSKFQIPNNRKFQIQNPKSKTISKSQFPKFKTESFGHWNLDIGIYLEFEIWDFWNFIRFGIWNLFQGDYR